jgi:hypothetical protein
MSISDKFFFFNKNPKIDGFRGRPFSSSTPVVSYPNTAYTYYTATNHLDVGDAVYTSSTLTTPINGPFSYNGYTYSVDDSGVITSKDICYNAWSYNVDCGGSGSGIVEFYTSFDDKYLSIGTPIYADSALTTPLNVTTYPMFVANGYRYILANDGPHTTISRIIECPSDILTLYSDCSQTFVIASVYTGINNIVSSVINNYSLLYTDIEFTNELGSISFEYSGNMYYYTQTLGTSIVGACGT